VGPHRVWYGRLLGALKLQELTMQEWTMTEEITGVDFAGVDNDKDSELQL